MTRHRRTAAAAFLQRTAAVGLSALLLTGCNSPSAEDASGNAPTTPAVEVPPSTAIEDTPAQTATASEPGENRCDPFDDTGLAPGQYCGMFSGQIRDDAPEVAMIRYVTSEEQAQVHAQCMTDAGMDLTYDGQGIEYTYSNDAQMLDLERQIHICQMMYPPDPRFDSVNLTTEQESILYDWFVTETVPCLRAAGHPVSDPPSKETWMGAGGHVIFRWSPWDELGSQAEAAQRECPGPPDDVLYPQ